jgi:hypothetical protein
MRNHNKHDTLWGKTETISPKIRNETRMPTFWLLINIVLEFLVRAIKQEEEIKGIQIDKEEVKLSLFVDDIILYLKYPKKTLPKNCLKL